MVESKYWTKTSHWFPLRPSLWEPSCLFAALAEPSNIYIYIFVYKEHVPSPAFEIAIYFLGPAVSLTKL